MANYRYFAECGGQPVMLQKVWHNGGLFSQVDSFTGRCEVCGEKHQATRKVQMKSNPSKHVCDSRCIFASGRTMRCECSCGGKNHGRGSFECRSA